MRYAVDNPGRYYIRVGRHPVPAVTPEGDEFHLGKAVQLADGDDVTLIATGTLVSRALDAAAPAALPKASARAC